MSAPSVPTRCLLDKNVVRYALAGLRHGPVRPLLPMEAGALSLWWLAERRGVSLYITDASAHVLARLSAYREVLTFLAAVSVLSPGPYARRWARRAREVASLAPEDAMMLALASFGTDDSGAILGVSVLATYDQGLIRTLQDRRPILEDRLQVMLAALNLPFRSVGLPRVMSPDDLVRNWEGSAS